MALVAIVFREDQRDPKAGGASKSFFTINFTLSSAPLKPRPQLLFP